MSIYKKYVEPFEDNDKKSYVHGFWSIAEPHLKRIVREKSSGTSYSSRKVSSRDRMGSKWEVKLTNKNKALTFTVELLPWNWTEGSLSINIDLADTKNIVIPKRKIQSLRNRPEVWRPTNGDDKYFFIKAFEPVFNYAKAIDLTPMDVGMFDNIEQLIRNTFK